MKPLRTRHYAPMLRARWLLAKAALLVAWAWLYMFIAVMAGMSAAHSESGMPTWPFTVFIIAAGLGWLYITFRLIRRWIRHYRRRFSSA